MTSIHTSAIKTLQKIVQERTEMLLSDMIIWLVVSLQRSAVNSAFWRDSP